MDIKQYLRDIIKQDRLIHTKLDEVQKLKDIAYKVGGSDLSNERVQMSLNSDKIGDVVSKIVNLEWEIIEDVERCIEIKRDLLSQINKLNNVDYQNVLTLRYFNSDFKTWEEIAAFLGYSYRQVLRIHGKALLELKKICKK